MQQYSVVDEINPKTGEVEFFVVDASGAKIPPPNGPFSGRGEAQSLADNLNMIARLAQEREAISRQQAEEERVEQEHEEQQQRTRKSSGLSL